MRLASEWMPSNTAFHCTYLAQMTNMLKAYDLAVTPIDQDAIIKGGTIDGVTFAGVSSCALPAGAVVTEPSAVPSATPVETVQVIPATNGTAASVPATSESPADAVSSEPPAVSPADEVDSPALATTGAEALPWMFGLTGFVVLTLAAVLLQLRRKA